MTMGDRIKRRTRAYVDDVDGDPVPSAPPLPATSQSTGDESVSPPVDRAGSTPARPT